MSNPNTPDTNTVEVVISTIIRCLVPGQDEPVQIDVENLEKLHALVHSIDEPVFLADVADRILTLAASIDQNRRSPKTADLLAELALKAAERSLQFQKHVRTEVHRVADVGKRYERFLAQHNEFQDRNTPPPKGSLKASLLQPKKRI